MKERKNLFTYGGFHCGDCPGYTGVIADRVLPKASHLLVVASLVLIIVLGTGLTLTRWLPTAANADTIINVNTTDDELNSDGDCSLREAIRAANSDAAVDACLAGSGADTIIPPSRYLHADLLGALSSMKLPLVI